MKRVVIALTLAFAATQGQCDEPAPFLPGGSYSKTVRNERFPVILWAAQVNIPATVRPVCTEVPGHEGVFQLKVVPQAWRIADGELRYINCHHSDTMQVTTLYQVVNQAVINACNDSEDRYFDSDFAEVEAVRVTEYFPQ